METLAKYIRYFRRLKVDRSHGVPAPHKPILLLSVLQLYKSGVIKDNRVYITPELVALFKANWSLLVISNHHCNIAYPFYHLKSSAFWKLIPKPSAVFINFQVSLSNLNSLIECAQIPEDLFSLAVSPQSNNALTDTILTEYFPQTRVNFSKSVAEQSHLFKDIEDIILKESPAKYSAEVKKLIEEKNEEEVYLRGNIFKKEIPKIYNYTCCISGMRVDSTLAISMVDACHIVPFSESYDDTITNGIALCPNLHRAFDRGLISIDENYKVLVSGLKVFSEKAVTYSIRKFEGKQIILPKNSKYHPSQINLEKHRNIKFIT